MNTSQDNNSPFFIGHNSNTGRSRQHNEDNYEFFWATVLPENDSSVRVPARVVVVADGIGGAVGGQEASRIAVGTIKQAINDRLLKPPVSKWLEQAILRANQAIHESVRQNPQLKNMGCTVVAAIITDKRLYLSHAGDSRAYLIRQDRIHLLTVDHTWVQEAIMAGQLTPQEAAKHPNRNVVKRYLGTNERLIVDNGIIDPPVDQKQTGHPETKQSIELQPGDVVILCTDGLSDLVTKPKMQAVIKQHKANLQEAVDKLIDRANAKGGTDNITVVAVALKEPKKLKTTVVKPCKKQSNKAGGPVLQIPLIPALLTVTALSLITIAIVLLIFNDASPDKQAAQLSATASSQNAAQPAVASAEHTPPPNLTPSSPPSSFTPTATTAWPTAQGSTSTPLSTFTPLPSSTPFPAPTSKPPNSQSATVSLLEPRDKITVKKIPVRFQVRVIGKQESDILQLRMWKTDINKQSTVRTPWRSVGANIYETDVEELPEGLTAGKNYSWTVVLLNADENEARDDKAPPRQILWNQPEGHHREIGITLLEPAAKSSAKNSPLEFKVRVAGMKEGDGLQLWMGTNESHLQPVEAQWLPAAGLDQFVAQLAEPPKGYGKQYDWTVTLVDPLGIPLPVPDAIELGWEE